MIAQNRGFSFFGSTSPAGYVLPAWKYTPGHGTNNLDPNMVPGGWVPWAQSRPVGTRVMMLDSVERWLYAQAEGGGVDRDAITVTNYLDLQFGIARAAGLIPDFIAFDNETDFPAPLLDSVVYAAVERNFPGVPWCNYATARTSPGVVWTPDRVNNVSTYGGTPNLPGYQQLSQEVAWYRDLFAAYPGTPCWGYVDSAVPPYQAVTPGQPVLYTRPFRRAMMSLSMPLCDGKLLGFDQDQSDDGLLTGARAEFLADMDAAYAAWVGLTGGQAVTAVLRVTVSAYRCFVSARLADGSIVAVATYASPHTGYQTEDNGAGGMIALPPTTDDTLTVLARQTVATPGRTRVLSVVARQPQGSGKVLSIAQQVTNA